MGILKTKLARQHVTDILINQRRKPLITNIAHQGRRPHLPLRTECRGAKHV